MDNGDIKKELIQWIHLLEDPVILQKIKTLKNNSIFGASDSESGRENAEKNDFDEQFAAGMSSEELLENIAAHLETMASDK